jgi:acetoin utilization protein AcuB
MRAEQIMTSSVVTLAPDSTRERARELLRRFRFRHLPIVGDHGRIVGIVSDRDVAGTGILQDVMIGRVLTAEPGTSIRELARVMVEERINALPIVESGRLVGIVTTTDVLRAIVRGAPVELWA